MCLVIDKNKQNIIVLGIKIDYKEVFSIGSAETWSRSMFVQRILKKAGDCQIKICWVSMVKASTEIANEFFATLI